MNIVIGFLAVVAKTSALGLSLVLDFLMLHMMYSSGGRLKDLLMDQAIGFGALFLISLAIYRALY